jgi:GTP-binding protein
MDQKIINIAVIAHVDHGKTTLVDALLKQTHVFRDNESEMSQTQIMDRGEIERERGITILAKNCAIIYNDTKINIIDTPGHADFSAEVERTLSMANGALLIVDAQEGPMPQTRFVLKKALEMGLKIIVVVNKIDKQFANPQATIDKTESLFLELATNDSQLEFPVIYAIGRNGAAYKDLPSNPAPEGNMQPLLDLIVESIPSTTPKEGPFKMVVSSLDADPHMGKIVIGKISQGQIKKSDKVIVTTDTAKVYTITDLRVFDGLGSRSVESAQTGEIALLSGVELVNIGDTISDPSDHETLESVDIADPTINMSLGPNTSPFAGREGKFTTSRQIEERLNKELEHNLSLKLEKLGNGKFTIAGRGELHLSVLLETMRREGYEMEVGKPEAIIIEKDGEKLEPVEEVNIFVPNEFVGVITEEFGKRFGTLVNMSPTLDNQTEFVYHIPTRATLGLRSHLLTATKGTVIYNATFISYEKLGKSIPQLRRGALIADQSGEALAYGLQNAQERGITFIDPATQIYEGMIVGINSKDEDITLNVCKGKKLTNMRSKSSDGTIQLTPAVKFSLEQSLDFLEADELLEITPISLRLRKKYLTDAERRRNKKKN